MGAQEAGLFQIRLFFVNCYSILNTTSSRTRANLVEKVYPWSSELDVLSFLKTFHHPRCFFFSFTWLMESPRYLSLWGHQHLERHVTPNPPSSELLRPNGPLRSQVDHGGHLRRADWPCPHASDMILGLHCIQMSTQVLICANWQQAQVPGILPDHDFKSKDQVITVHPVGSINV